MVKNLFRIVKLENETFYLLFHLCFLKFLLPALTITSKQKFGEIRSSLWWEENQTEQGYANRICVDE